VPDAGRLSLVSSHVWRRTSDQSRIASATQNTPHSSGLLAPFRAHARGQVEKDLNVIWAQSQENELQGFAAIDVRDITLTLGLEYPRDFTMAVQGLQESITVTGESPVVDTTGDSRIVQFGLKFVC
jgi:hypothetical protein